MPEIRISLTLPYALRLAEGEYQTAPVGEILRVSVPPLEEMNPQTVVSATFPHEEIPDPDEKQKVAPGMRIACSGGRIACCAGIGPSASARALRS